MRSSLPGLLFVLVGIAALQLRRDKSSFLNPINAIQWEVVDLCLRGFFLAVLLTKAIINYGAGDITSFVFFLLSRLWMVLLWIVFAFALSLRPDRADDEEEEGDSSENDNNGPHHHQHQHHLCQLIKYEVLSSKFRITVFSMVAVCGLLDLSILRLLPWLPTEFSKYVGGYPNLFSLRCCVYGSNVSLVLQCIASILLLAQGGGGGQSSSDLALSAISVVLSISLMLKTFMETVFGIQKERSVKMVTVLELDQHLLRSVATQSASRESLIKKLDEIAKLRFSDYSSSSEVVLWNSHHNPLRATMAMDKTAIVLELVQVSKAAGAELKGRPDEAEEVVVEVVTTTTTTAAAAAAVDTTTIVDSTAITTTVPNNKEDNKGEPSSSSGRYSTAVRYADKTLDVMKRFMAKSENEVPIYIPLEEINAELSTIMGAVNAGRPFDEKRLDYLLLCMNYNEDYIREREEEAQRWRDRMDVFSQECLFTMRGFVPPHIFSASLVSLTDTDGLSQPLAKRLLTKKCLWLVRMDPECTRRICSTGQVDAMSI